MLIDHGLGGGVKDCWVAEGRAARVLYARTVTKMADNPMAVFEDIDARQAFELLQAALAPPVCPVQEDQIEDVAANLALLRARVALLAQEAGVSVIEPASGQRGSG